MDPVSSAVASYLGDKAVQAIESAFRIQVLERWTRHRARQFFDAFSRSLLDVGRTNDEIGVMLNDLLSNDANSEAMFEAYRSVCLSKSKNLGPRVIALLTAEILLSERKASFDDELIFAAAEALSDEELEESSKFAVSWVAKANQPSKSGCRSLKDGSLEISWGKDTLDSNWMPETARGVGPLDLARDVALWASKLKALGLLSDEVREQQWRYKEDAERHIDQDGVAREISWWLKLSPAALALATFVERARAGYET